MSIPSHSETARSELAGVPREGEVLAGRYRVERVLGVGGMGVVVAAMHLELDERVAVKFLAPSMAPQADAVARFVREAKAAIKIRSDHVVRVLDSGKLESGAPYIVMEYLDGRDLHAVLEEEGPLPAQTAVDYLLQACDAIAAAHALGIIHRDLKPGNLFLTRRADGSPLVKVLDFGISKVMSGSAISAPSGLTTTATIMGTPAFMSPEQLRSTRHVDARADIWSMGTILYALLAGEPPYAGESTADIAAKIIRDPPPPLSAVRPEVPEGLEAVVTRCLEKDPDGRYAGIAELAEALLPYASASSRASAERIAKQISARQLGAAPTLLSSRPASPSTPGPRTSSATRTASAFEAKRGEPETKRGRAGVLAGVVVGAVIVGVVTAALVPSRMHAVVGAGPAPGADGTSPAPPERDPHQAVTPSEVRPAPPASAVVLPPARAIPSAAPVGVATAAASPPATPSSAPRTGKRSTPPVAKATPAGPAATATAPAPSSSAGLFDDRE
jgi:serine/threonine-protein kinase